MLIKIVDSQNYPLEIQMVAVEAIMNVCRSGTNKKKVISRNIVWALIKISMSSCNAHDLEKYDYNLRLMAIKCLITLGGIYNRKMYIPGETRDNDTARRILIENGGFIALMMIAQNAIEESLRKEPNIFLENLDLCDLDYQLVLLKKWKEGQDGKVTMSAMDMRGHDGDSINNTSVNLKINANNFITMTTNKQLTPKQAGQYIANALGIIEGDFLNFICAHNY